jgi:integrase-like protein
VSARQGQYINRNSITVAAYLDQWLEAHAVEVKPKTLQDYRHLINRHVRPYIGELRLQAMSPARLTKLYRELATNGGRNGAGLSPRTVEHVVAARLGHADPSITLRVYAHVISDQLTEAADIFARAVAATS